MAIPSRFDDDGVETFGFQDPVDVDVGHRGEHDPCLFMAQVAIVLRHALCKQGQCRLEPTLILR